MQWGDWHFVSWLWVFSTNAGTQLQLLWGRPIPASGVFLVGITRVNIEIYKFAQIPLEPKKFYTTFFTYSSTPQDLFTLYRSHISILLIVDAFKCMLITILELVAKGHTALQTSQIFSWQHYCEDLRVSCHCSNGSSTTWFSLYVQIFYRHYRNNKPYYNHVCKHNFLWHKRTKLFCLTKT